MYSVSEFRAIVSGQRQGIKANLLRRTLHVAEIPYSLAVRGRNCGYDLGILPAYRAQVPVVSVGNLTLGGTGKTPMVEWIARWFLQHGVRVGVISRGYGAKSGLANDEAMELRERLPEVPHVQNPDRVAAARTAVTEFGCQAIVLDDAFQHRRIARDLDIVLLDALEPFGFGHVFPRGSLREPISGLRRADLIVLSRARMLETPAREAIRQQVARLAPKAGWAEADHCPQRLRNASGGNLPTEALAGKAVAAFCGVGNPAGFQHTLQMCGYRVIAFREFADHYRYTRADVDSLIAWAEDLDAEAVVCTHKDLVKLGLDSIGCRPLWAVTIALEFLAGQADLAARLAHLVSA